ncbi:MAG TPA: VWA domain-containing protein [Candidatus Acidoferrum sp.]|nr:VWA domain-containing protein [Candidatus Acidoferrum sp.]
MPIETSVLDTHGDFVGGLAENSFRVLDNGVDEPIQFFAPVEAPAEVLILLETSPAVYLIHNQHLAAASALVEGLAPGDQVALVTYDERPEAALGFTTDKTSLLAALGKTQYTIGAGDLKLYDSLSVVLDWLARMAGKREIVLLTTGLDSSPPARWEALAQKLRGEDVVVFCVALGGPLRGESGQKPRGKKISGKAPDPKSNSTDAFGQADAVLRSLATMTGGRAYFPQSDQDFAPIYREIASAMRHQYVLGIVPAHDNQFHTLTVEVGSSSSQPDPGRAKRSEYQVLARSGYLAPAP